MHIVVVECSGGISEVGMEEWIHIERCLVCIRCREVVWNRNWNMIMMCYLSFDGKFYCIEEKNRTST